MFGLFYFCVFFFSHYFFVDYDLDISNSRKITWDFILFYSPFPIGFLLVLVY